MIGALLLPLVEKLVGGGLTTMADAVMTKGKEAVENLLGVDLEDTAKNDTGMLKLRELEMKHEEVLREFALAEQKLSYEAIAADQKEVTSRWKSDNKAGGINRWVRPGSLIATFCLYAFMIVSDGFGFTVNPVYSKGVETLLFIMVPAYFGARSFDKFKGGK